MRENNNHQKVETKQQEAEKYHLKKDEFDKNGMLEWVKS